jgi:hypothetical protein
VIGLGGLVIATAVAVGTGANFNATSTNPGSLIRAGAIAVTDSLPGNSILTVSPMKPGASSSATVSIANSGNVSATLSLAKANLVDVPASPQFSGKLTLVLQDLGDPTCTTTCPAPVTMYSGPLGSMGTVNLGVFAAAVTHQYRFSVAFPDGGSGGADNAYGGASTTVDYKWTATQ